MGIPTLSHIRSLKIDHGGIKMNTQHIKTIFARIAYLTVILAILLSTTTVVYAAGSSPFVGHWQAVDTDGSDIRLTIGGPPAGPFQITWTESHMNFCNQEAGILRGTGQLNQTDPNLIEADLHLKCLTTGAALDLAFVWRYHPSANTLSASYGNGVIMIWHRPGQSQPQPPTLDLRVNYGEDWVESFYEGGHTAWVTVTESDGVTVKAMAELVTEPKDFWGGETGFQTSPEGWVPAQPDIQPNDWVFGWVDNGASAQVQIGEIRGTIDLVNDSIEGTILAPWITDPVPVECLDWGSGEEPFSNKDGGFVLTNGEDPYACSWAGEWDIQPGQAIGVGYFSPEGHWVANAFSTPMPTFVAYVPGAIEGYDWPIGSTITVDINDGEYSAQAVSEQEPGSPEGATRVLFDLGGNGFSIEAGDHVVMTDGIVTKDTVVTNLAVTDINVSAGTVSGIYDPAYTLWVWLYDGDGQVPAADPDTGTWTAIFAELPLGAWGGATQWEADGDGTSLDFQVPAPRLMAFPAADQIFGYYWPEGSDVQLTINNSPDFMQTATVGPAPWDANDIMAFFDFGGLYDLKPGDVITLSGSGMQLTYTVLNLSVTNVDVAADTVSGTADPATSLSVSPFEFADQALQVTADGDGNWLANFAEAGIDLVEGMCGRAEMYDESTDNSTAVDWCIPTP